MSLVEVVCHGCRGEFTVHLAAVGNCPRCSSDDLDLPAALIEAQHGVVGVRKQAGHVTNVESRPSEVIYDASMYLATCTCGWHGRWRSDFWDADDDARAHKDDQSKEASRRTAVSTDLVDDSTDDTCPTCGGTGEIGGARCYTCGGSGKTSIASRRTAEAKLTPLAQRTAAILTDIAADNPHLSRAQRVKLAAEAIRRTEGVAQ